ncbi:hypothetical protein FRAHR75_130088 [Frankia sp. Hr75.2]|nr:hypothetical protein FRAHR75_130088 [Frankia sp. Hr75.2]
MTGAEVVAVQAIPLTGPGAGNGGSVLWWAMFAKPFLDLSCRLGVGRWCIGVTVGLRLPPLPARGSPTHLTSTRSRIFVGVPVWEGARDLDRAR